VEVQQNCGEKNQPKRTNKKILLKNAFMLQKKLKEVSANRMCVASMIFYSNIEINLHYTASNSQRVFL